jgi:hypothetical protein
MASLRASPKAKVHSLHNMNVHPGTGTKATHPPKAKASRTTQARGETLPLMHPHSLATSATLVCKMDRN